MNVKVNHFTAEQIRELEEKRGAEIADKITGEFFEVVAINIFCDQIADINRANAANAFRTYQQAAGFAACMNDMETERGIDQSQQTVYVVKARNIDYI